MSKVGIITIPRADNYGSVLQAYAVQQFINETEPDNELIDYVSPFLVGRYKLWNIKKGNLLVKAKSLVRNCLTYNGRIKKKRKYAEFRKLMKFSEKTIYSADDIERYEKYIVGSDQIWNTRITDYDQTFFLNFVNEIESKIAFSVSMGYVDRSDKEIEFYKKMLTNFKWIGVREKSDIQFVKSIAVAADTVDYIIDPTLLISEENWSNLLKERIIKEDYILVYSFGNDSKVIKRAKNLSEKNHLPVYIIADEWRKKNLDGFNNLSGVGPIEFINLIAYAEHIVTNSFHGTAFSIIFRKQFTIVPYKGTENRVLTLLKLLKLENGIYGNDMENSIIYSDIDNILQYERNKARIFLQKAMGKCGNDITFNSL